MGATRGGSPVKAVVRSSAKIATVGRKASLPVGLVHVGLGSNSSVL